MQIPRSLAGEDEYDRIIGAREHDRAPAALAHQAEAQWVGLRCCSSPPPRYPSAPALCSPCPSAPLPLCSPARPSRPGSIATTFLPPPSEKGARLRPDVRPRWREDVREGS